MAEWMRGGVGYEIYVRSFADSDGDGFGDLEGVRQRLDYLEWLGVDAIWMTPFYPSPGFDAGYDVTDHTDIDPRHGNLADFDALVEDAHRRGIRVVVDIVPNHTSHLHPWFVESRASRDSPLRDFYLWRDPAPDGGPPNNWVSHFGGPAWTFDEPTGQYYCHLFLPEQPDLNWSNEEVRSHIDDVLRFWCERGVDGFRVDVAHSLMKHPSFADNPQVREPPAGADAWTVFDSFDHRHDLDQDETLEIHRRWRSVVDPYGAVLLGEIGIADPQRVARYTRGGEGLHRVFFLELARIGWEPARLVETLRALHTLDPDHIAWIVDSHDTSRSASRLGGGERGATRSLVLSTLIFGLGGTPFLYQGQELGLEDGVVDPANLIDPVATRNTGEPGRDGARTGMPWSMGPNNGFTTGTPWLPAHPREPGATVEMQANTAGSWAHRHRDLIATRRNLPDLWSAEAAWLDTDRPGVACIRRGASLIVANLEVHPFDLDLPDGSWAVAHATTPVTLHNGTLSLPPESTAYLRTLDS